jgi:hypothetical protein
MNVVEENEVVELERNQTTKFRVRNDDDNGSWKELCCIYLD